MTKKPKVSAWKEEIGKCPFCNRCVATYKPAGGDGSARLFYPHINTTGTGCVGSKREDPNW